MLKYPFSAAVSTADFFPALTPSAPFLALGAGGWGISDTLRVAGAAALIFVAALTWVVVLKVRTRQQNFLLKAQL